MNITTITPPSPSYVRQTRRLAARLGCKLLKTTGAHLYCVVDSHGRLRVRSTTLRECDLWLGLPAKYRR